MKITIDASDYYGGPVFGIDENGVEWVKEGEIWHRTDNHQVANEPVEEIWIGK